MKKIIFLAIVIFLSINLTAQSTMQVYGKSVPVYINRGYGMTTDLPKQKTAPKGSVYLVDDWMKGTIVLKDSSYFEDIKYKYNFRSKYLEILDKTDSVQVLFFAKVDWMYYETNKGSQVFENCTNFVLEHPELGDCEFVQIMAFGRATLIDKLTMEMIESNYNAALDAGETSDTYYIKHTYYILKDGELIRIAKNKGSILNALSEKKDQLKSYIKTNKLKMKEPENIAKVVEFYNSLYEESTN
ncbi:MAG: hypothetical protein JXL97_07010 [Bacteroidales bacterium]|nr:hypothetical protein [Bacteroidales bacterium]